MLHMLPRATTPVVVQLASETVDARLSPTSVAPLPPQAEEYDEETRPLPLTEPVVGCTAPGWAAFLPYVGKQHDVFLGTSGKNWRHATLPPMVLVEGRAAAGVGGRAAPTAPGHVGLMRN